MAAITGDQAAGGLASGDIVDVEDACDKVVENFSFRDGHVGCTFIVRKTGIGLTATTGGLIKGITWCMDPGRHEREWMGVEPTAARNATRHRF